MARSARPISTRRRASRLQHLGNGVGMEGRRHLGYAAGRHPPARGDVARRARAEPVRAVRRAHGYDASRTSPIRSAIRRTSRWSFQNTIGNTDLRPEIARNTQLGIVYSRPSWLPGLSLSFDYYSIKLNGVVSTLSADQIVRFCFEGNQAFCGGFELDNPNSGRELCERPAVQSRLLGRPADSTSKRATSGKGRSAFRAASPSGRSARISGNSWSMRACRASTWSIMPAPTLAPPPIGSG